MCQLIGAVIGTAIASIVSRDAFIKNLGAINSLQPGVSVGSGLLAEVCGTFILVFTVLFACDSKRHNAVIHLPALAPFAIGYAVMLAHVALIPVTNCSINSARSFGSALVVQMK